MASSPSRTLSVPRFPQPDDVSCGPVCLMQVLRFYGDPTSFETLSSAVPRNQDGGTLAVYLALTAIRHGYATRIYTYNLDIFDPTWHRLDGTQLDAKLAERGQLVRPRKLRAALDAYRTYLKLGGELSFQELTPRLLVHALDRGHPLLTGLSATHLYRQVRERAADNAADDVGGGPVGHFVVVCGYRAGGRRFVIRDPQSHVPFSKTGRYTVDSARLLNSILLGAATYDAVLLEIWPRRRHR